MSFDEQLIELIKGKQFLYDRKHANYRNGELKDLEWNKIALGLDTTAQRCKKRWGTLRDRFKRINKRRTLRSPNSSSGSLFTKKWKYYDALSFIPCSVEHNLTIKQFADDGITADTTFIEFMPTASQQGGSSLTSDTKTKSNDLTEYFSGFVEEARNAVSKLPGTSTPVPKDATEDFFTYLGKRVKAANLSAMQEMRIEAAILNFTVDKLFEMQNEM